MSGPITPAQIRAIHAIKTRTRLDDGSYRALLAAYGVGTSKDLTEAEAERLLARLRDIPGAGGPLRRPGSVAAGPYGAKLRALWIALHNLGAVRDPRDSAMHAFLTRQTGLPHTRFLREVRAAKAAIEALKGWLTREGVRWPEAAEADPEAAKCAMKRAILEAQWRKLIALGAVTPCGDGAACDGLLAYVSTTVTGHARRLGALADPSLTGRDLDTAARTLGAWIRRVRAPEEHRDVA